MITLGSKIQSSVVWECVKSEFWKNRCQLARNIGWETVGLTVTSFFQRRLDRSFDRCWTEIEKVEGVYTRMGSHAEASTEAEGWFETTFVWALDVELNADSGTEAGLS